MKLLLYPFCLFLDLVSPWRSLAPASLVVLAAALVIFTASILIRTRIANKKQHYESTGKRDTQTDGKKES